MRWNRQCESRMCLALVTWAVSILVPITVLASSSSLYPSKKKEAGALKLAQVTGLASRAEIVAFKKDYQRLLDSGLPDSALVDRSIGAGRVYCCGGLPAATHLDELWFYVPPDIPVEPGDFVEIRLGQEPGKKSAGRVNAVTQARERVNATERRCRWEPPNDRLWMRVIYCDWMTAEGWTHKNGIGNPWIKPATLDTLD